MGNELGQEINIREEIITGQEINMRQQMNMGQ